MPNKILAISLLLAVFCLSSKTALGAVQSPKKGAGIAISPLIECGSQDLNNPCVSNFLQKFRSLGITWLYNWGVGKPKWIDNNVEYVPMVYGSGTGPNRAYTASELSSFAGFAKTHPGSYWLIWNEPDYSKQANITAVIAAVIYKPLRDAIIAADPTSKFIVGGLAFMDTSWINSFREEYKRIHSVYPPLDGWAFHHYMGTDYSSSLWRNRINNIKRWFMDKGYQSKEFWLTEYGSLQSNAIGLRIMRDQQEWLEAPIQSWITRYAWFYLGITEKDNFQGNLFTGDLTQNRIDLSELGREYAIHPLATPTACGSIAGSACCSTHTCQSSSGLYCLQLTPSLETCNRVADKNSSIAEWSSAFTAFNESHDFNDDSQVDGLDYVIWLRTGKTLNF